MKKFNLKSFMCAVLALAVLCGLPVFSGVFADTTPTFTDVKPGDAHYEAITAAVKAGIINGYGDGTFGPNDPITQQQLIVAIDRACGNTERSVNDRTDAWANKVVDRGTMAFRMWYWFKSWVAPRNVQLTLGNNASRNADARQASGNVHDFVRYITDFSDVETINTWSMEYAVAFAEANPSTSGDDKAFAKQLRTAIGVTYQYDLTKWLVGADMKFDPYATITRGELCQCLYNAGIVGLAPVGTAPYSVPVTGVTPVAPVTPTEPEPEEPVAPVTVAGFTDVMSDNYFAGAVSWAVDNGVTSGTSKTTFSPYASVTRAQAVTFMWRAAGCPEPAGKTSPFTDVTDADAYYYKPILWAAEKGITSGVSKTLFGVNSPVAYDQMFAFLARFAGADTGSGDWSANAISWANSAGLTDGLSFTAKAACPRCDVVYALWKQLG